MSNTILGIPLHKLGIMGPKTLFQLLRPLEYAFSVGYKASKPKKASRKGAFGVGKAGSAQKRLSPEP